jgi:dephospho-CoA kinase
MNSQQAPLRLGLTGGIGSGKSTVAQLLAGLGAGVIDADAISRATTAARGAAIPLIQAQFGDAMIGEDGALHRERMRQHIFTDPQAKARLEAIIHPLVGLAIAAQTKVLTNAGKACIVYDIPLLVESGHWRTRLQRVLVVDCSPATQIGRVTARSGLDAPEVEKIIAAQASRRQRLAAADIVLFNDGISLPELATQVQAIGLQFGL